MEQPAQKRPRLDDDADVAPKQSSAPPPPYHDVRLKGHALAHLRIFILPNAWICARIYSSEGDLFKKDTFTFPRIDRELADSSVCYELEEWNGAESVKYDPISIAMVLASLEGDEQKLRALDEIHIEGRDERVVKCLEKKRH